jgi:hypothetical protein
MNLFCERGLKSSKLLNRRRVGAVDRKERRIACLLCPAVYFQSLGGAATLVQICHGLRLIDRIFGHFTEGGPFPACDCQEA